MPPVQLTAVIEGEPLDPKAFERAIRAVLEEETNEIEARYEAFYGTWEDEKPNMPKVVRMTGNEAYGEVSTRGHEEEKGNKKLLWLDEGTIERWAIMSRDWQSKTQPGRIRSGSGHGRVVVRGKRRMSHPRPGIQARNVSQAIADEREPEFQRNVNDALESA